MEIKLIYREGEYSHDDHRTYDKKNDYLVIGPETIGIQTGSFVLLLCKTANRIYNYFHEDFGYLLIIRNKPLDTPKFLEEAKKFICNIDVEKAKRLHMTLRRIADGVTQEELDNIRF